MSSMQDLPGLTALAPVSPQTDVPARPRLRAVPDVPLDFDDAVRTLTPRLVRYATRRLGDVHEAEEVVQEALLRAYKHREELLTEDDLAAWSTCVTGRLVIDRLRVRGRSTSVAEVPEGTRVGRDTADVVVARDEARTALDALDAMPPRQAAVLWAREVEGLAYDEIGTRFGMTEPAVRSILTRARKALRKEYAARGGTLPAGGLAAIAPWADGLGWLERLRGAVGRVTAPAALGVVTTGLLAGGLLTVPMIAPNPTSPGTVQTTVVTAMAQVPGDAVVPHGGSTNIGARSSHRSSAGQNVLSEPDKRLDRVQRDGIGRVVHEATCVDSDGNTVTPPGPLGGPPITLPVGVDLDGNLGVGDSACAQGDSKARYEISSPVEDPTGLGVGGVVFWSGDECLVTGSEASNHTLDTPSPVKCENIPSEDKS